MEKKMNKPSLIANRGFTLIELMIAMAISTFVMTAIYMTFNNQQKSYLIQDEVTSMQQNVRAGMYYLENGIRMAGFDPDGQGATITAANNNSITFDRDDGEGTGTIVTNTYSYVPNTLDWNGQPVSEEIQALGFAYSFDATTDNDYDGVIDDSTKDDGRIDTYQDASGRVRIIWAVPGAGGGNWFNLDTDNDGVIDDNDSPTPGAGNNETLVGTDTGISVDESRIRAVRISLLARTGRGDKEFYNNHTYIVGNQKITPRSDGDPANDDCRMRLLTTIVKCRNMGL